MYRLRSLIVQLVNLLRRSRLESDLKEQFDVHREMIQSDLISRGVNAADAEAAARRAMGNELLVRELSADQMLHRWIEGSMRDIKYALRSLCRTSGFAIAVVLTLALGIGANTAIFSMVDRVLLRPLPFPDPERIMLIHETGLNAPHMDVNPANWLDWQRDSKKFVSFAAWTDRVPSTLTGQGEPERLESEMVSHEFFSVLGVKPFLGSDFTEEMDRPGTTPAAIASYSLWQRKFGGDPNIIGKTVELNSTQVQLVGVMPQRFRFMSSDTQIWRLFALPRNLAWRQRGGRFLPYVVARVKPDVAPAAAKVELENVAGLLAQTYDFNKNTSVSVVPLREVLTGQVRTSLLVLFAAVGALLLVACSNVANLLIARSAQRRREVAIRVSVGAGRGAIIRQLLIESVLLASIGGIAGIVLARWCLGVLMRLAPPKLLPIEGIGIDRSMLLYTLALSLLTGVLVGLVPAWPSIRLAIADHLRNGSRSVTASVRLRKALLIVQVAMTVVLLCGAGLLVRSLLKLTADPIGVNPKDVLTMRVELPGSRYNEDQEVRFFQSLQERLRGLPGVESVGGSSAIPVDPQRTGGTDFRILGESEGTRTDEISHSTKVRVIMPGYIKALGIPLGQGRDFVDDDLRANAPQSFIVNEAFAKKYLSSQDPLSASLSVFMRRTNPSNPMFGPPDNPYGTIVGITGDVKEGTLRDGPEPTVFYNERQLPSNGMTFFLKTTLGPEPAKEVAQIVRQMDRNLPLIEVRMLDDALSESIARDRVNAIVSGAFAVLALLLASIGLYGLLSFSVAERTTEIGVRMALGAQAEQVLKMICGEGFRLVLIGSAIGLIAAAAVSRFLDSLLFHVTRYDPVTFIAVIALLAFVALVAILIPARRATRVEPIAALREE